MTKRLQKKAGCFSHYYCFPFN